MDKRLILAVAGSGKTYHIVQKLNEEERFLLITYTINGTANLKREVINKFGFLPKNITIRNYFSFLYSFCYKPFLSDEIGAKGICWEYPKGIYNKSYLTKNKYLYHNRISKLLIDKKIISELNQRLAKYYDYLLIDEIQDFGGNDFNLLIEISKANMNILFVGDFFQHTFSTSRDKNTNQSLHKDLNTFVNKFTKIGIVCDEKTLTKSRRCSKTTCDFIREKLGVQIFSNSDDVTECRLITNQIEVDKIMEDKSITKLFYQKHYDYVCQSNNWGASKGLGFQNVCVIINNEVNKFFKNGTTFDFKSSITKNKFYVACSRSRGNLFFIHNNKVKKYKK